MHNSKLEWSIQKQAGKESWVTKPTKNMPNIFDIRMQSKQHKYSLRSRQTNDWKMSIEWEKEMCDEYELQKQKKATRESRRKEKTTMNLHKKDTTNCTLTKFYSLIVYTLLFFLLSLHTFVHLRAHMSICLDYLHAKKYIWPYVFVYFRFLCICTFVKSIEAWNFYFEYV